MVLVIDDNLIYQELIHDVLETVGLQSLSAFDGRRGIDLYKMHQAEIDAICLDLQMPGLSGIETFHQLRLLNQDLPIIFCTANDILWVQRLCKDDPAVYFFEKSQGLKEFLAVLQRANPQIHVAPLHLTHACSVKLTR